MDDDKFGLLTEAELAQRLGKSLMTMRRWRARRQGPAYIRMGGQQIYYRREAVEQWLAALEQVPPPRADRG